MNWKEMMTEFVAGRYQVLVSTTIIESGLDIPNSNTIIIEGADRFGLSQLYQLRGRVGRFKHQAYAYLLLHRHTRLLEVARQRLTAMRQHNQLGAGFRIAMRDLELRGAGNLLGAEQSGHIVGVGFELYCQLLAAVGRAAERREDRGGDSGEREARFRFRRRRRSNAADRCRRVPRADGMSMVTPPSRTRRTGRGAVEVAQDPGADPVRRTSPKRGCASISIASWRWRTRPRR